MEFIDIIDIKLRNFIIYGPTLLRTREALGVQKFKFNQLAGLSIFVVYSDEGSWGDGVGGIYMSILWNNY